MTKPRKKISTARKCVGAVLMVVLMTTAVAFARGWFRTFEVVSYSMAPTIDVGDYLMVVQDGLARPRRGDIVAFKNPDDPVHWLCKRLMAMPEDLVEFRFGHLYVNDTLISKTRYSPGERMTGNSNYRIRLADEYFVVGDNQAESLDSRDFGPVGGENMIGVVTRIYWPWAHARSLQNEYLKIQRNFQE